MSGKVQRDEAPKSEVTVGPAQVGTRLPGLIMSSHRGSRAVSAGRRGDLVHPMRTVTKGVARREE